MSQGKCEGCISKLCGTRAREKKNNGKIIVISSDKLRDFFVERECCSSSGSLQESRVARVGAYEGEIKRW